MPVAADLPPLAAWGIEAALEPLSGGHRNRVLRTRGLAVDRVFKTTRRSAEALAWLGPLHAAATAAGFRVPALIASLRGAASEAGWTCEPFLAGRAFAEREVARVAPQLAAFHAATKALPQRPGFRAAADFADAAQGGDIDLGLMPAPLVRACRAAWAALADLPRAAVHGDLCAGNLLWGDDGTPALLDWDEARHDAAVFDHGQTVPVPPAIARAFDAWEVAVCWQIEPERARALAGRLLAD
ncbi:MAG: hypothetical protein CVT82_04605 [Alphaproteobacteria bacterium HGW-Alphaproteobacteria-4]|nr:MAG: hypothetical protein CVT82_04605 [Alphaproteobacteria bacterium HGW-Alphaproteobacteria-4]